MGSNGSGGAKLGVSCGTNGIGGGDDGGAAAESPPLEVGGPNTRSCKLESREPLLLTTV